MESEYKTLEQLSAFANIKMSSQTQQEIWNNLENEIDQFKPERTKRYPSFFGTSVAAFAAFAVIGIVAGGFYASFKEGVTSKIHPPAVSTASNQTPDKVPYLPSKPVSSTDTATIKLMKQVARFKAILPSYLPKGYRDYKVMFTNPPKNDSHIGVHHQSVYFLFTSANQKKFFKLLEFPYAVSKNTPTNSNSSADASHNLKYMTIDGTQVVDLGGIQYRFVKNGLLFQVISQGNSQKDTMKFLKSLIEEGMAWN